MVTSYKYLLTISQNVAIGVHVHRQCFIIGFCVLHLVHKDLEGVDLWSFGGTKYGTFALCSSLNCISLYNSLLIVRLILLLPVIIRT